MTTSPARVTSDLLSVADLDVQEVAALLELAAQMKRHPLAWRDSLDGRAVACCFAKPSTRTRVSFEAAIFRLGGLPILLGPEELQLGGGEAIADTARVLSTYCDAIVVRTSAQSEVVELARHASVPIINALTDEHSPCQALADCLTLQERFGTLDGLTVAYLGEDDNLSTSLKEAAERTGMDLRVATPPVDPRAAVRGARAVYTDAWMPAHRTDHERYRVTPELMMLAAPDVVFLHSRPAHRGQEVDDAVIDGPQSLVWRQAANRLPTEQALLRALVTGEWQA